MALKLDLTRPLRGTADLIRLVEAVFAADEHDESDWIEWKTSLDVTTKPGCFHIARTVLGLANRMPETARRTCGGLGYMIVGAAPGTLDGIASVDPAVLGQLVEPYLGGNNGPSWSPIYVAVGSRTVLVAVVEAPAIGDPIYALRHGFDRWGSGTVFVRHLGRTEPADANDLDALQARLMGQRPVDGLEVRITGETPVSWIDVPLLRGVAETQIASKRDAQIVAAEEVQRLRDGPVEPDSRERAGIDIPAIRAITDFMAQQSRALEEAGYFGEADTRTLDDYRGEVRDWARTASVDAPLAALRRYFQRGRGIVRVMIHNGTGRFLTDTEVEIQFDETVAIVTGSDSWPRRLQSPPRAYGARTPGILANLQIPDFNPYLGATAPGLTPLNSRIVVDEQSNRLCFRVGDLRQGAVDTSQPIRLIVNGRPSSGRLTVAWRATIREPESVVSGAIDLPVAEDAVDPTELLRSLETEDGPETEDAAE